ncbi:hypothetical protein [Thorsellia anophelis]|uniref:Uncharacterized protein n=1 Tax=Thorsellia anophelis DSM 18579 TaxID=1123402 RepID=A0A1I0D4I8_9GAMM|nr:hypothetical protein [Thorsellia anophelis]SET27154.1 hypothetical protein SAMN02583745_01845 [Thorsellia anophelis DSM 18579]
MGNIVVIDINERKQFYLFILLSIILSSAVYTHLASLYSLLMEFRVLRLFLPRFPSEISISKASEYGVGVIVILPFSLPFLIAGLTFKYLKEKDKYKQQIKILKISCTSFVLWRALLHIFNYPHQNVVVDVLQFLYFFVMLLFFINILQKEKYAPHYIIKKIDNFNFKLYAFLFFIFCPIYLGPAMMHIFMFEIHIDDKDGGRDLLGIFPVSIMLYVIGLIGAIVFMPATIATSIFYMLTTKIHRYIQNVLCSLVGFITCAAITDYSDLVSYFKGELNILEFIKAVEPLSYMGFLGGFIVAAGLNYYRKIPANIALINLIIAYILLMLILPYLYIVKLQIAFYYQLN